MTKEEKKERRQMRHQLQKVVRNNGFDQFKLCATENQLKQEAKRVASQLLAGRNPHTAVGL